MSFARIRGQDRPLHWIRRALEAGRLPHALLLSGPDGVGKRTTALELAKAVNCAASASPVADRSGGAGGNEQGACDACPSCRLVDRGSHPDVLVLAPDGRWLKIAQTREAARHVALSPYVGRRRVAIIDAADAMTPEAANAFLKTLEEPPGSAMLILISAAPTALLPTVRSRCQEVRFGPLPDDVLVALLAADGLGGDDAQRAATLGGGSVGQARLWAERFPLARQEELLRGTWAGLASPGRALAWAKQLAEEFRGKRDLVPWALHLLGAWARDLANPPPGDGRTSLFDLGRDHVSRHAAFTFYGAVAKAQEALESNVNLQLALDAMLLRMHAALAGQRSS